MNLKPKDAIMQNKVFVWIAFATGLILLIPLIAMQLTNEVTWDRIDFIIMGVLLFSIGSLFVLAARRFPQRRQILIGIMILIVLLYVWAELAVGIFTDFES